MLVGNEGVEQQNGNTKAVMYARTAAATFVFCVSGFCCLLVQMQEWVAGFVRGMRKLAANSCTSGSHSFTACWQAKAQVLLQLNLHGSFHFLLGY